VILFSAAELIVGAMLMAGALTRTAALVSMGFSVLLMAMFGWQGATCIDEWTMAACNLAMGATLLLGGCDACSIDNVLIRSMADRLARPSIISRSATLDCARMAPSASTSISMPARRRRKSTSSRPICSTLIDSQYDAAALSGLSKTAFVNDYAYNKFAPGPFGIRASMGAAATVTLPPPASGATAQVRSIRLTDVDGRTFSATLDSKP
jgi:hypothetical protein